MLLEREYDEGHDDDEDDEDEAVCEEKRREIFAFNVVKDVADIRVSFLTRAIASDVTVAPMRRARRINRRSNRSYYH